MRSPTAVLVMATAAALAPGCGYSWKQGKRTFPPTVCVREKSWTTTGLVYIGTLTFRSGNVDANAFGRRHGADVATVRNLGGGGSYTNTLIFSNGAAITHHGSVAGKVAVTFYRQTHFRFHKGHENERPPWYKRHFACPAGTRMVCGHLEQYCATKKFGVRMGPLPPVVPTPPPPPAPLVPVPMAADPVPVDPPPPMEVGAGVGSGSPWIDFITAMESV